MLRDYIDNLDKKKVYRFLEIIPGVLVWTTLIGAVVLSFVKPLWAIYVIIIFDLYWLLRVTYLIIYLLSSWKQYRVTLRADWFEKVKVLPHYNDIYHLIFLPTFREPYEVVVKSIESLTQIKYPLDKLIVVLAGEERDQANFELVSTSIKQQYGDRFGYFLITLHPGNIIGEMAGKGANTNWAGHQAKKLIDNLKIPYKNVVVSTFDVDSCAHPQYFAYLTYKYLTVPDPLHTSYQPLAVYNNNIWESPAINRIVANSTTFWLLTDLARPERLFTFSSHSMPFTALVDVGFWQNDIVTEDSRIFLQCFIRYNGNYRVTPMYIPISMDTVYAGSLWRSVVNQYKQQRRWAYGVENFPYMAWHFWRSRTIPFNRKIRYLWNQLEGVYSWATAPLIIFILGRLPLWTADDAVKSNLLAHNAPMALQWIMTLAMIGLVLSAILSTAMLPSRDTKQPWYKYIPMVMQWFLFPITMIVFGAIPATDAQTRLMLGKYLGFWVTEKKQAVD